MDKVTMSEVIDFVTEEALKRIEGRERTAKFIARGLAQMGFFIGLGIFLAYTW